MAIWARVRPPAAPSRSWSICRRAPPSRPSPAATTTVALTSDGQVRARGDNRYGQAGDGTTTNRPDLPLRQPTARPLRCAAPHPAKGSGAARRTA
ncbi:hypothetical protein [Streptomyces sp. KHY 26]|uniref:hypothetical protein n=1 Tax=Streptomyces sp. KHY 26 TaxID=3097359 RepID=UPI00376EDC65